MAKKKNEEKEIVQVDDADSFSKDIIKEINKSYGSGAEVYDFSDEKFEEVSRWISTGCKSLDYLISNRRDGGYPEGKVIEIYGPSAIGKSLLGYQAIKSAQEMGGIGVLIDTEYATYPPYLEELGVNTKDRFIFSSQKCVEKIFDLIDKIIVSAANKARGRPVVIVWDSIAASASKKELEGDYEQVTIGELARALGKGMKRIIEPVAASKVTLLLLNQTRTKIGVMYGDPEDSCGGQAMKYYPSLRIKLSGGRGIFEDEKKEVRIGNGVIATIVKSRVSPPNRKCEFELIFGQGTRENDQLFDAMREVGTVTVDNEKAVLEGVGAWKTFTLSSAKTGEVFKEIKFYKYEFTDKVLSIPEFNKHCLALMDAALIRINNKEETTKENKNES